MNPVALIYAGGPGSGKTRYSKEAAEKSKRLRICPDELKYKVPGYTNLVAKDPDLARVDVHDKVGRLAKRALADAIIEKMSFIYDSTMSGKCATKFVKLLLYHGYDVDVVFMDVPIETASERMTYRDKRTIPLNVLSAYHVQAAANFFEIRNYLRVNSLALYETSGKTRELVYHKFCGSVLILNQELYETFGKKATTPTDGSGVDVFDTLKDVSDLEEMICFK